MVLRMVIGSRGNRGGAGGCGTPGLVLDPDKINP